MSTVVFLGFIAFSLYLAFRSKRGHNAQSVHDFFVASRQFGVYLVFFLAAGEIYSIGTMVGLPGGIYAKGATYGVWFLGYILLAYPIGYFIGPKMWEAGKKYNAITLPDLFKGHYQSRFLEVVVTVSAILFLIPWGQLQFTGLVAALKSLGWNLEPIYLIFISAFLAFIYIIFSGVRATAYIAILKDILMVVAIVVAGVAVSWEFGVTEVFRVASAHVSNTMNTKQITFSMSTMFFQSLGFYMFPFAVQNFFTAKSANTIRKTQIAMPLYMLMYPFLIVASYYAISANLTLDNPNEAFFAAAVNLLPGWLLGLVTAGAALSGLLVLAGICLSIGPLVTRNLVPNIPESKQKTSTIFVIVIYLATSIVLTLFTPNLMLTIINTAYYGITQFFPGMMIILFFKGVKANAVALGIIVGQVLAILMYVNKIDLGGFNIGLICLLVNIIVLCTAHFLMKLCSKSMQTVLP